jgi:hypothetical protein
MVKVRKATTADYINRQGGIPTITRDGKIWVITHNYLSESPEIRTHISPKQRGTVIIGGVEYEVSKLWEFEGAPCERQSRLAGGEGYPRSGNSEKRG